MKKSIKLAFLIPATVFLFCTADSSAQNTILFRTQGQQYGNVDLDVFYLSNSEDGKEVVYTRACNPPDSFSVGRSIFRSHARRDPLWGQFGCRDADAWPAKAGAAMWKDVPGSGKKWIRIRYSKHSPSLHPVEIWVNGSKAAEFLPENQGDWNSFTMTAWIPIQLTEPK